MSALLELPSVPASLANRVRFTANACEIQEGLSYDEWLELGLQLRGFERAVSWWIGDWLAYGEFAYKDKAYGKRMPNGVYEKAAQIFDRQPKTLRNYKWACVNIAPVARTERLKMQHAFELLSAAVPAGQIPVWTRQIAEEGIKTRDLRKKLRATYAAATKEPHDAGEDDFLSRTNQWVLDFQHASATWTKVQWDAFGELLEPVFGAFERRAA